MNLDQLNQEIVNLEKARKEYLHLERPYLKEKAEIKTWIAKQKVRLCEIEEGLAVIKDSLDQNQIDLSLAKKEYWNLKSELGA